MRQFPASPAFGLALSAMLLFGCASHAPEPPELPKYVAPNLEPSQAAVVRGSSGTYVITVDNTSVPGMPVELDWGGNKVLLAPGRHLITVERRTSAAMASHTSTAAYECVFEAGHLYVVGEASFSSNAPKMTDMTNGKEIPAK